MADWDIIGSCFAALSLIVKAPAKIGILFLILVVVIAAIHYFEGDGDTED